MEPKKKQHATTSRLPRTEAAIRAYAETGDETDPLGMWTGRPRMDNSAHLHPGEKPPANADRPVQDADDL